jgi:chemotaxis protein methyltransferase CheR
MIQEFHVLIVDDDHRLCQELSDVLIGAGYGVNCLSAQENPYPRIREISPDLVILDISPAASRGLETLRRLELQRPPRKVPVIITSRQAELEYELLDVFDFLPKPLDHQRLLEDIALLAGRSRRAGVDPFPPMQEAELSLFQDFLVTHSGLHFDQRNIRILERGLMRRMQAVKAADYRDYFGYLEKFQESRQELKKLLGLLTIGETYFFRYLAHFEALVQAVIPELILRNQSRRSLRIWSAGCSTGEEAYSLAMLLEENFPELSDWDVRILGTDINKRALRCAREAAFGPRSLRVTDPRYRDKFFCKVGSSYILHPRIRNRVCFSYLNLQTGVFPSEENGTTGLDIIFCRNVMIYFRLGTVRRIVEKFSRCLQPGGYLFLGHAETLMNLSDQFQRAHFGGGFYYRRKDEKDLGEQPPNPVSSPPPAPPRIKPAVLPMPAPPPHPPEKLPLPEAVPDLEEVFRKAEQAFDREDFQTASQFYDIILRHLPRHVGALVGSGFLLANQGRFSEALELCSLALEVDDLCPAAYFLRGLILDLEGDLAGAVTEYRKALLLDMNFIMAHYNLGKVWQRKDREREARRELRNTLRLLENSEDEAIIPYSGGLSRAVFLEVCRDDFAQSGGSG